MDLFDDILPDPVVTTSRAGGRFQPKSKPRPRKESSAPASSTLPSDTKERATGVSSADFDNKQCDYSVDMTENMFMNVSDLPIVASECILNNKPSKNGENSFCDGNRKLATYHLSTEEGVAAEDSLLLDDIMIESNGDSHPLFTNRAMEVGSTGFDLHPSVLEAPMANASASDKQPGMKLCPQKEATTMAGTTLASIIASDGNVDLHSSFQQLVVENVDIFYGSDSVDDLLTQPASGVAYGAVDSSPCDPVERVGGLMIQDSVTCMAANHDGAIQIDNGRFQNASVDSSLDIIDFEGTIACGERAGKFKPKPKLKKVIENTSTDINHPEVSIMNAPASQAASCETRDMEESLVPASQPDDILNYSSVRFDDFISLDSNSEVPVNEEPTNLEVTHNSNDEVMGNLHSDNLSSMPVQMSSKSTNEISSTTSNPHQKCGRSCHAGDEFEFGKKTRQQRAQNFLERVNYLDNEHNENTESPNESQGNYVVDENEVGSTLKKKAPSMSKKSAAESGKPVRKCKGANEETEGSSVGKRPKKFPHSTRRKRRQVDKALLDIPEDEMDFKNVPIKDMLILCDYKERLANKDNGSITLPSERADNEASRNEEGDFSMEQGIGAAADDDEEARKVNLKSTYLNYQTYMDKEPRAKWSKQETARFYEAVRQFGPVFSMIHLMFPGRTLRQIKLKYKNEERRHPLEISEAYNRSKDHSHFISVIERLKQASAQEKDESNGDDLTDDTRNEIEETTLEANEEVGKSELDGVDVNDKEAESAEVRSSLKSDESDEDFFDFSEYKSAF